MLLRFDENSPSNAATDEVFESGGRFQARPCRPYRPLQIYRKSTHHQSVHQSVLPRTSYCVHYGSIRSERLFPKRVVSVRLARRSGSVLSHLLVFRTLQHCYLFFLVQTLGEARHQIRRQETARETKTTRAVAIAIGAPYGRPR